jgi:hypothetical protein
MSESASNILSASAAKVAGIMDLGQTTTRVWRPDELAAVFRHQMAAPVSVDLAGLSPKVSGKLRTLTDASGLLLKSFQDLFQHPDPPLELLQMVKEFAKLNRDQPESVIPSEIATVLYYMSIAAALVRRGERITSLGDGDLRRGFTWAMGQAWLDEPARGLLEKGVQALRANVPK